MTATERNLRQHRERILHKLHQITNYPVTLLVSPPGYGKSYLLAQYCNEVAGPVCWVALDDRHRFLKEFLNHLVQSLRSIFPNLDWEDIGDKAYPAILFNDAERNNWLLRLKERFEEIGRPVVIVLDQYHHIDEASFIHRLLNHFILMMPENLHLVITTRFSPSGEAFRTLQIKNLLFEINERDLQLTRDEVDLLFRELYQFTLSKKEVEVLHDFTLGWQRLLHHCYLDLSRGSKLEQIIHDPLAHLGPFYEYVEEEIIKPLPSYIQGFIRDISILDAVEPEVLNFLFQGYGKEMLHYLERHHLVCFSNGTTLKRVHPALRKYLLKDYPTHEQLHRRLFYFYIQKEDYAASIPHLIGAREWEELAYLLSTLGGRLVYLGHLKAVREGIEALPDSYKQTFPRVFIVEGDYYRLHSEYSKAVKLYQSALSKCREQGDREGELLAIEGEVRVYLDTVKPNRAEALLKKAYYQTGDISSEMRARIIHLMAENYINNGRPRTAKRLIKLAGKISSSLHTEAEESRLLLRTGQLQAAASLLQKRDEFKARESTPLILGFREGSLVLSLIYAFMGMADEAKRQAQQGILLGTQMKSPFIEATGWARMGHAMQIVTPYNANLAEECYQTSLQIFHEIGIEWGQAEPLMGLALLHGINGNFELCISYGKEAKRIAESVSDNWMYQLTQLCMGIGAFYHGDYNKAEEILLQAHEGIKACGDHFLEAAIALWRSYALFQQEKEEEAYQIFHRCLTLVARHGYEFIFRTRSFFGHKDLQINIPLFLEVQSRSSSDENQLLVSHLLKEMGFGQVKFHPGYTLKIETLGGFRVWLGDKEVLEKDWQRANAKRLFQYLITKRKQEVLKEVIQAELWPDLDEEAADRDFKVALNALTKALEPDRKARSSSFYVVRHGTAYQLNPDSGYQLDAELFAQYFEEGLNCKEEDQALKLLETGFSLYRGDYLSDNLYEDWAIEERERLQVLFIRGSERLARIYLRQGKYEQAIKTAEKIIEKDICWEEAYRIIMLAYYKQMNRTMALRWFEKCKQNLFDELGVEPMFETQKLKEMIQSGAEL